MNLPAAFGVKTMTEVYDILDKRKILRRIKKLKKIKAKYEENNKRT